MQTRQVPSVRVTVRLFASLRELTGEHVSHVEIAEGSRASDVWDACVRRWPALASRRQSTVLAVNQEFASPDVVIHDGDEVALLPPVSGGRSSRQMDQNA